MICKEKIHFHQFLQLTRFSSFEPFFLNVLPKPSERPTIFDFFCSEDFSIILERRLVEIVSSTAYSGTTMKKVGQNHRWTKSKVLYKGPIAIVGPKNVLTNIEHRVFVWTIVCLTTPIISTNLNSIFHKDNFAIIHYTLYGPSGLGDCVFFVA